MLVGLVLTSPLAAASDRPNILFLFADDWGRHASIYARVDGPGSINDAVQTPNFDRLADSGVLFTRAFVNAPSCTPCRSSLFSGRHFWRTGHGAVLHGATWDAGIPTFPLLLEQSGYDLGYCYKAWSPGSPANAPIGGARTAYNRAGTRFRSFSQSATQMIQEGMSVEQAKRALLDEARGNFRAFLDDHEPDRPFLFWFGPTNVHRKWVRGSGEAFWGLDPDDLKGKLPPFLPDVHEVRQDLADYLGEVQAFDAAIGVLVDELKQTGEYENTLIVVSGDHGPAGFPHGKCNLYDFGTRVALAIAGPGVVGGRVVDDFVSLPDLAPTLLEAGGLEAPAAMTARSLWPVLRSAEQGLVDAERTQVYTGRERHVSWARDGDLPYPQRAIRTADHLLILNFRPDRYPLGAPYRLDSGDPPSREELTTNTHATLADEDAGPTKAWIVEHRSDPKWGAFYDHAYGKRPRLELYDIRRDPHQMQNLAARPEYASVAEELETRLLSELQRTGDPRLVAEGWFFEDVAKFKLHERDRRRRPRR